MKTRGDDDDDNTTHTLTHNLVFVVGLMSRQSTLFLIFFCLSDVFYRIIL